MRPRLGWVLPLTFLCLLGGALVAGADTVHLKDGTVIRGKVVRYENDQFVIQLGATDSHRMHQERLTVTAHSVLRVDFSEGEELPPPTVPGGQGVTLYVDDGYRGRNEVLYDSDPDLRNNSIGNDSVTSIRVPSGYVVTLYSDVNYGGRSVVVRGDVADLGATTLGNDTLSSIRIERIEPGPGVTLYVDEGFRGRSEVLYDSDPDLRNNSIGNDSVTSVRVPRGYVVTLYTDVSYGGRSVVIRDDVNDLGRTTLGNDTLSSVRIEWTGRQ